MAGAHRDAGSVTSGPALTILAVDRQPLFLAALRQLLGESLVEVVSRSDVVLAMVERAHVDLVLCEARAEPLTGTQLAAELGRRRPGLPVVLLGDADDAGLVIRALQEGAAGFLSKDVSLGQLMSGLRAVLSGHLVISRGLGQAGLLNERASRPQDSELTGLTEAERAVLEMLGQARSVEEIASLRGASQKTVRNQVASIYRKLDLRNRTEAMLCAVRLGLVDRRDLTGDPGPMAHSKSGELSRSL